MSTQTILRHGSIDNCEGCEACGETPISYSHIYNYSPFKQRVLILTVLIFAAIAAAGIFIHFGVIPTPSTLTIFHTTISLQHWLSPLSVAVGILISGGCIIALTRDLIKKARICNHINSMQGFLDSDT